FKLHSIDNYNVVRRQDKAMASDTKIHAPADSRLATMTATHAEALRRLKDMHSTLADLVAAEDKAGALESGLSREEASELVKEPEPQQDQAEQAKPKPQGQAEQVKPKSQNQTEQTEPQPQVQTEQTQPQPQVQDEQAEPKSQGRAQGQASESKGEEATKKLAALPQEPEEATVRIKPVPRKDSGQQEAPASVKEATKSDEEP